MPGAQNIEITSESSQGFEDAIRKGIEQAAKTVENIKGVWVDEQKVRIENGKVAAYQVDIRVSFAHR